MFETVFATSLYALKHLNSLQSHEIHYCCASLISKTVYSFTGISYLNTVAVGLQFCLVGNLEVVVLVQIAVYHQFDFGCFASKY